MNSTANYHFLFSHSKLLVINYQLLYIYIFAYEAFVTPSSTVPILPLFVILSSDFRFLLLIVFLWHGMSFSHLKLTRRFSPNRFFYSLKLPLFLKYYWMCKLAINPCCSWNALGSCSSFDGDWRNFGQSI